MVYVGYCKNKWRSGDETGNNVSAKINKKEDIENVDVCVSYIARASKKVARKLANGIDINAFSSKINKEEDIQKIGFSV